MGIKLVLTRTVVAFTIFGWADELEKIDFNVKLRDKLVTVLRVVGEKVGGKWIG